VNLLVEVLAWLAAGYIAVVAIMYVAQTRLIFPTYLASFATGRLPSSAERISVTASDGDPSRRCGLLARCRAQLG
jgi:hypothetical protein